MKVRILSDLHLDVNSSHAFKLIGKEKDVFTVLAGDTSGDPQLTIAWAKKNLKQGLLISGNHLVYNRQHLPIQDLRQQLADAFPLESDITYLDVLTGCFKKEVNGVLFIGTTLYTDFKLKSPYANGKQAQERNMSLSWRYMNDYRWGLLSEDEHITPADVLKWFEKSFAAVEQAVSENELKPNPLPVVIITHHAPSRDCIAARYNDSETNASYVSELDEFIQAHPSIHAWIYGHIHDALKAEVIERDDDSKCLLINNARGYVHHLEDHDFNKNTFLDTDTWTIERKPLSRSQIQKRKKGADAYIKAMAPFIF